MSVFFFGKNENLKEVNYSYKKLCLFKKVNYNYTNSKKLIKN